jgi:hypothetical protein
MTVKNKSKSDIKSIQVKGTDALYIGPEPDFHGFAPEQMTQWALAKGLNWYNYVLDSKVARDFIVQYLELNDQPAKAKIIRRVSDKEINSTYGWVARCTMRGFQLNTTQQDQLSAEIDRLVSTVASDDTPKEEKAASNRPNVQEIMRERTLEAGGELEGLWDDYLADGIKKDATIKVIEELTKRNILPQHVGLLITPWKEKLEEYQAVLTGDDEQLTEAYDRFSRPQIKNIIRTIEQIISDLNSYISVKKAGKKPRAKKQVPVEKRVAKLKYLKTFKEGKLDLVSISPVKLYGAEECWAYDTAKRKLHHYVADDLNKTFVIKGNTIIGFDTKQSEIKTLRKPEIQLKEIMGSKPAARKFFKEIKAVAATPNGRFNANMIILRAF